MPYIFKINQGNIDIPLNEKRYKNHTLILYSIKIAFDFNNEIKPTKPGKIALKFNENWQFNSNECLKKLFNEDYLAMTLSTVNGQSIELLNRKREFKFTEDMNQTVKANIILECDYIFDYQSYQILIEYEVI